MKNSNNNKLLINRICTERNRTITKVFNMQRTSSESQKLCRKLGGRTTILNKQFEKLFDKDPTSEVSSLWVPIDYNVSSKFWQDTNTGKEMKEIRWSTNFPLDYNTRNCVYFRKAQQAFMNARCSIDLYHYCHFSQRVQFGLHGTCKDSIIDNNYTIYVDEETDEIHWKGFGKTDILRNNSSGQWEIKDVYEPYKVLAITVQNAAENEFYPLGVHTWKLFSDSCKEIGNTTMVKFLFSNCDQTQFSCSDGSCIPLERRCDLFPDCEDKTDEVDCRVLSNAADTYKGYEVNFPTLPEKGEQLNLSIYVNVTQIVDIKDLDLRFIAKLTIEIEWFDVQVHWINLKERARRNFLNEDEKLKIWIPKINFGNSENIDPFLADKSAVVYVKRISNGSSSIYTGEKKRAFYYDGKDNPLTYKRSFQNSFFCDFNYKWFPFDTQHCYISFETFNSLVHSVNLVPKAANYTGNPSLLVFNVEDVAFENIGQPSDIIKLNIK